MRVIFLSIGDVSSLHMSEHGVYTDLMRCFQKNGHEVFVVTSRERKNNKTTELIDECGINVLRVKIGNITKCGLLEKGISTVLIPLAFKKAIDRYFKEAKFDLVLYSTPPITLASLIKYLKRKGAASYLMLKDIFPQNAVDLGIMSKSGLRAIPYLYFRQKEKKLYAVSDKIGCMSQANVNYILKHNPELAPSKVQICPNSIEVQDFRISIEDRNKIRQKYGIPEDKTVFVYGGNLGKPQDIQFIIECLKKSEQNNKAFFLIIGHGTEYGKLESYFNEVKPLNMKLMRQLPKEDYDRMIASCDIGLIFLDHHFTIPNFPSRLLSYMQAGLPILACTDKNTDIGKVIVEGGFGWWCESDNADKLCFLIDAILLDLFNNKKKTREMGVHSQLYLEKNYNVEKTYLTIQSSF